MNIYNANILNERINISIFTFEKKSLKIYILKIKLDICSILEEKK